MYYSFTVNFWLIYEMTNASRLSGDWLSIRRDSLWDAFQEIL